jgi:hypothetical protein
MWGEGEIKWTELDGKPIKANALYTHFQKLTKQSEAFLAGASQLLEHGSDENGDSAEAETAVQAVSLCGEIIAARDDLERAMKILAKTPQSAVQDAPPAQEKRENKSKGKGESKGKGKSKKTQGKDKNTGDALALERRYAQECERLAFAHVALPQDGSGAYEGYAYAAQLRDSANATRNPRDRLHLVKELAVMATSLPPGVWVRVDEVRNDAV